MRKIKIGSRASRLALVQAEIIINSLRESFPEYQYEIIKIQTMGDKILDKTLDKIGGKGLFVKEIQTALMEGAIDLAIHSMKDMPAVSLDELTLGAIPKREDPRDVLITKNRVSLKDLPQGAIIGSSSLRRQAQLLHIRPDLNTVPIRGNVETRIHKIETQNLDGVILAAAGLKRLGLEDRIDHYFPLEEFIPAVGQGALGCEIRKNDEELFQMLQRINDPESYGIVMGERRFLEVMEGGCHISIGAYGSKVEDQLWLTGMVASPDGKEVIKETLRGSFSDYERVGEELALKMINLGAKKLIKE